MKQHSGRSTTPATQRHRTLFPYGALAGIYVPSGAPARRSARCLPTAAPSLLLYNPAAPPVLPPPTSRLKYPRCAEYGPSNRSSRSSSSSRYAFTPSRWCLLGLVAFLHCTTFTSSISYCLHINPSSTSQLLLLLLSFAYTQANPLTPSYIVLRRKWCKLACHLPTSAYPPSPINKYSRSLPTCLICFNMLMQYSGLSSLCWVQIVQSNSPKYMFTCSNGIMRCVSTYMFLIHQIN